MINSKEVLETWKNLKAKIKGSWKEGKVLTFDKYTEPKQPDEELKNLLRGRENLLHEIREFERERTTFTKLESKLERVKDLISEGKIEKLKSLVKRGEI